MLQKQSEGDVPTARAWPNSAASTLPHDISASIQNANKALNPHTNALPPPGKITPDTSWQQTLFLPPLCQRALQLALSAFDRDAEAPGLRAASCICEQKGQNENSDGTHRFGTTNLKKTREKQGV